jgi:arsenic resistance protein ArsH
VQELRELSKWSDGHVWVSPEQHGNLVCSFHLSSEDQTDGTGRLPSSKIKLIGFR